MFFQDHDHVTPPELSQPPAASQRLRMSYRASGFRVHFEPQGLNPKP